jgi:beta-lactamase class A
MKSFLLGLLVLLSSGFLLYKGYLYLGVRDVLPVGTTIAGVDVAGLTLDAAQEKVAAAYAKPLVVVHQSERVEIEPPQLGFVLDLDTMMAETERAWTAQNFFEGYLGYLGNNPMRPIETPLHATHDPAAVHLAVQAVAGILDRPAQAAQITATSMSVQQAQGGYVTNLEASIPAVEAALYNPDLAGREVALVVEEQAETASDITLLQSFIETRLRTFEGMGSIFVMDLRTGEEIGINADVALSGLSILKVAVFVEAYRVLDEPPNEYQQQLFVDTAAHSSNFGANLLLHLVAGEENTYKGADILTESMHHLGLVNTFMAVPYDAPIPANRPTTYVTPANSRTDVNTLPDPTMQTTAEEMGTLLSMIYYCSKGGGALLAVYPDDFTPEECQAIIDLMVLNEEGNLIRFGVPEDVRVSHKHGWALGTHGDAGIVFSPAGDYVLVEYLNRTDDWLQADQSFPILRDISRVAYNFFNPNAPFLGTHEALEAVGGEAVDAIYRQDGTETRGR